MRSKKTSSGETLNKYMKGFSFWNQNAFWRDNAMYSTKSKNYFEAWLRRMKSNETQLTKLEPSIGNGIRV